MKYFSFILCILCVVCAFAFLHPANSAGILVSLFGFYFFLLMTFVFNVAEG